MSGKLIIQGKAWGEFESAKRSKGNIEISGYRSYGGTHTVRMVDQPQLNENQQIVLEFLKGIAVKTDSAPIVTFADFGWQHFGSALPSTVEQAYQSMNGKQDLVVMSAYVNWALEQEEE